MSSPSAFCDSLMNTAHVVCIDQSESRPSLTPVRRTNAITVSVRSTSSSRSVVSISMVSATTASPPTAADVALGTGVSRTVTTELLLITLHSILAAHGPEQGRAAWPALPRRRVIAFVCYPDTDGKWVKSPHGPATVSELFASQDTSCHGPITTGARDTWEANLTVPCRRERFVPLRAGLAAGRRRGQSSSDRRLAHRHPRPKRIRQDHAAAPVRSEERRCRERV